MDICHPRGRERGKRYFTCPRFGIQPVSIDNNRDHSMLTARTAVANIIAGVTDKSNIWAVNTEEEYHEAKGKLTR